MGADSSAENTPEFICPIILPEPKFLDLNEKRLNWASVVRGMIYPVTKIFHFEFNWKFWLCQSFYEAIEKK